jgi:hypothetical protein
VYTTNPDCSFGSQEDDVCTVTLPAGAVLLRDGFTNPVTLRLGKYKYWPYP